MSHFDPWTTRPIETLPGLPPGVARTFMAAKESGQYLNTEERDEIIRAAGGDPTDWTPERIHERHPKRGA